MLTVIFCGLALTICALLGVLKWNNIRYSKKGMPQGSMGWPVLGETLRFLNEGPDFMKRSKSRYGSLFKTHALGSPMVVSMDPDVNRYILVNEAKGLVPGYPDSMRKILGRTNIAEAHGAVHKRIRGSLLSLVGTAAVKDRLLPEVELTKISLDNLDGKTIDLQKKSVDMAFFISWKAVIEDVSDSFIENFKATFDKMTLATISLPINFPGTQYYQGMKTRREVITMLREVLAKRRASSDTHDDYLDHLLRNEDGKHKLDDEEIMDQIITIIFSGYETVSTTSMMSIKYLGDNPSVLQEVRDEHFSIMEKKKPGEKINWDDYKNMRLTRAVILETMRLASVVAGEMRRTTNDVELNGFVIPKGWRVYVYTRESNYDPILYEEPYTFNPRRWLEKGLESHNHNLLFGAGPRVCPGKEWGLLRITLFIHNFVTRYRWEEAKVNQKIMKFPRVLGPEGFHIRVTKY